MLQANEWQLVELCYRNIRWVIDADSLLLMERHLPSFLWCSIQIQNHVINLENSSDTFACNLIVDLHKIWHLKVIVYRFWCVIFLSSIEQVKLQWKEREMHLGSGHLEDHIKKEKKQLKLWKPFLHSWPGGLKIKNLYFMGSTLEWLGSLEVNYINLLVKVRFQDRAMTR